MSLRIGSGTYAKVWLSSNGRVHKIIPNPVTGLPSFDALMEMVATSKITSPYVISLLGIIIEPNQTILVYPLARASLFDRISDPRLPTLKVIRQLCQGLAAIHQANFLHLDIKPNNILLHDQDDVWIIDFGVSEIHPTIQSSLNYIPFNPHYRAPEAKELTQVTAKSDVWALGVVIAEIFISQRRGCGTYLFNEIVSDEPVYPDNLPDYLVNKGLTSEKADFVLSMLIVDPVKRPTIFEVLHHPFLQNGEVFSSELTSYQKLLPYVKAVPNNWQKWSFRVIVIDWLTEVKNEYQFSELALSLGVHLLDYRQAHRPIKVKSIQLYAIASLYLAGIFYDNIDDSVDEMAYVTDSTFTSQEIISVIQELLELIRFDLSAVTTYGLLQHHLATYSEEIKKVALDLWEMSLMTRRHFNEPTQVADDIVVLATRQLTPSAQQLRDEIMNISVSLTKYSESRLRATQDLLSGIN